MPWLGGEWRHTRARACCCNTRRSGGGARPFCEQRQRLVLQLLRGWRTTASLMLLPPRLPQLGAMACLPHSRGIGTHALGACAGYQTARAADALCHAEAGWIRGGGEGG